MSAEVEQFLCATDNFGVLVHDPATGATASIDACEEAPILRALEAKGWTLTHILVTHHHDDHIAAIPALNELTHLPIILDPSHATGKRSLVPALSRAAVAIGADGLLMEIHPCPEKARYSKLNGRAKVRSPDPR